MSVKNKSDLSIKLLLINHTGNSVFMCFCVQSRICWVWAGAEVGDPGSVGCIQHQPADRLTDLGFVQAPGEAMLPGRYGTGLKTSPDVLQNWFSDPWSVTQLQC